MQQPGWWRHVQDVWALAPRRVSKACQSSSVAMAVEQASRAQSYPEVWPVVEGCKVDGCRLMLGGEVVPRQRGPAIAWVGALGLHAQIAQ